MVGHSTQMQQYVAVQMHHDAWCQMQQRCNVAVVYSTAE